MTGERLFALLSDLPDDLIDEAATATRRKTHLLQYTALAACAALVIFAGSLLLPSWQSKSAGPAMPPSAADSAAPEAAPSDPPPASADGGLAATPDGAGDSAAGGSQEGFDSAGQEAPAAEPPGFWNGYSLNSDAVTVYVPSETGWSATEFTDWQPIKGIYTRLFISDPEVMEPSGLPPTVLVDLQNGFALALRQLEDGSDEATLYTVPDGPALADALAQGEDPWPHLTVTDPAVRYTTELTAYVLDLRP